MDLNAPLLLYCERLGPGLWAEPLNAVSNLAFFGFAWKLWRENRGGEPGSPSLVTFLASKKVTRLPGETGAAVRASKCVDVLRLLYATLSTNGSRCVDVLRLRCAALSTNGYLWEIRSRR